MKKLLTIFCAFICALNVFSSDDYDCIIDGLYYKLNSSDKTAIITFGEEWGGYSGVIDIPSSISYESQTYEVTTIGRAAFSDCSLLTEVTIPNSVLTIESDAFYCCTGLTSITIGNSVREIELCAFQTLKKLSDVIVNWTSNEQLPSIGDLNFLAVYASSATLHVPFGTKSIYEVADVWKEFGIIIDDITPITNLNTLPDKGKDGKGSKYFHNGNLIIERNGIKYTATGQKVR